MLNKEKNGGYQSGQGVNCGFRCLKFPICGVNRTGEKQSLPIRKIIDIFTEKYIPNKCDDRTENTSLEGLRQP